MDANVQGMQPTVREYCKYPQSGCRRKTVLKDFGIGIPNLVISRFGDHHLSPLMGCSISKSLGMFAPFFPCFLQVEVQAEVENHMLRHV